MASLSCWLAVPWRGICVFKPLFLHKVAVASTQLQLSHSFWTAITARTHRVRCWLMTGYVLRPASSADVGITMGAKTA